MAKHYHDRCIRVCDLLNPDPGSATGDWEASGEPLRGVMMALLLLVDMRLVALRSLVAIVGVLVMLAGMLRGKGWSGEEREKQNRRNKSLHGADGSMRAIYAGGKSSPRHQKMNVREHAASAAGPVGMAMKAQAMPDGGDDGGGDGVHKPMRDLRTPTRVELPQESSS
jgi:hypothetical protein